MATYKLAYFDIRGLAEVSRFIFAAANQPYEDYRFPFSMKVPGDFSTVVREEFDAAKASGELDRSLGKVPYLEVGGTKIGQSKAIERFLAKEFGMMGDTPVEAALIDMLCETVRDIKDAYGKIRGISDEAAKKAAMDKWFAEDLPNWVKLADKSLPEGKTFMVGSKVSLADIIWYQLLLAPKGFFDNTEGAKAALSQSARIKAAMEAVDAIPSLQEYIAKRPDSPF